MRYSLALTAAWLLVPTGHAQNNDSLVGTWIVVSTTNGGKDDSQLKHHTATFAGGKVTFKSKDGKVHAATYTLDASMKPATVDLVPNDGAHQGKTLKAIYAVEQNELKLCIGKEGEDRPIAFSSKAGEQSVLLMLKRADASKLQDGPPPLRVFDHGGSFRPAASGGRDLILLSLAFSPDGSILASAGGGKPEGARGPAKGEIKLWRMSTGEVLKTMDVENGIVFQVAFSLDGKLLATASGSGSSVPEVPGEVRLWNAATGELVNRLKGHSGGVYSVAFSPDGKMLASGSMPPMPLPHKELAEIKLWDLKTAKELRTLRGHAGAVGSLVFTADGKTLASGGGRFDGRVKLWDVATGTDLGTLGLEAETAGVMPFIPNSPTLMVCSTTPLGMQLSRWDIREKKQIEVFDIEDGFPYRIARSHKGDLIAYTCNNSVRLYDASKQVEVRSILPSKFRMRPVAFSPDDAFLAAGSDDGTVRLWNAAKLRD